MTSLELQGLLPAIIVAVSSVVVLVAIAVRRSHRTAWALTCLGLVAALIAAIRLANTQGAARSLLIATDPFAQFFAAVIIGTSLVVAVLAYDYLALCREHREELYVVLLLATLGAIVLAASVHFVSLFLGLEVLTVSLYVMIAYLRDLARSLEAGIKYLLLAAASSAFMLFGLALIYGATGTMEFAGLSRLMTDRGSDVMALAGVALFIVGAGYKLALVPFHMWTPDIYEGAPAPVTAFVATVPKGAMMGLVVRFFLGIGGFASSGAGIALAVVGVASMFVGNLLALLQPNVKRMLAYSSIAHMGYMLVGLLAGGALAVQSVSFYVVAYTVTSLGAFGILSLLSRGAEEPMTLDDFRGLFWSRPWIASVMTAMLLSLAGIPLTAGFVGKFLLVAAGAGSALWTLIILLVVNSAISLYYYLRLVVAMFTRPEMPRETYAPVIGAGGTVLLSMLFLGLLFLGVYPQPLLRFLGSMTTAFMQLLHPSGVF